MYSHVRLADRLRRTNRSAALRIQRAWMRYNKPLRQAIVCGPPRYSYTSMVYALGGFYQTHMSVYTTHLLSDSHDTLLGASAHVRRKSPRWLERLHNNHASKHAAVIRSDMSAAKLPAENDQE